MRSIISKWIFLICALAVIRIVFAFGKEILPSYETKLEFLLENSESFNTVLLGSSRVEKSLDPKSINNNKIFAYNLGYGGTQLFQTVENVQKLLSHTNLQYFALEIIDLHKNSNNFESIASPLINRISLEFLSSDFNGNTLLFSTNVVENFITNSIYFGTNYPESFVLNENFKTSNLGHVPSESILNFSQKNKITNTKFLSDTSVLFHPRNVIKTFDMRNTPIGYEKGMVKTLKSLIEMVESKGKKVYFFLPPFLVEEEIEAKLRIINSLPVNNILSIHKDEKYWSLYQAQNAFDRMHTNRKGVELYSRMFKEAILDKINNGN